MKKVFFHIVRLYRKFWFFLALAFIISPVIGLAVLIIATILSLALFDDPVEAKRLKDYFTEDELRKIQADEDLDDEESLHLIAKCQSYQCPVKVDRISTWTSSEVTEDAYICSYEINDKWHIYSEIDMEDLKKSILADLDKKSSWVQSIVATNRNLIFRYWNIQDETLGEVILSKEDLMS